MEGQKVIKTEYKSNTKPYTRKKPYWCIHCGERFVFKNNKNAHEKKCEQFFFAPNKFKDVAPPE